MKKTAILALISFAFFACKKGNTETYSVKFITTGNDVTQFKFYQGQTTADKAVPFSGTQDTTVVVSAGTMVKLDSKANSNNLTGAILVNGKEVVTGVDADTDGDGKSQVKIVYTLPK
ncbi:MAG: hypothetical protein V4676_07410 [Bacteroidota bacterium]